MFTRNSIYIREWIFNGLGHLATLRISIFGVWGAHDHLGWECQVYHNIPNIKPKFNLMHILIINENILGAFGALHD